MSDHQPHPNADRLLQWLLRIGIADFLLISAFEIHRYRRENWQLFHQAFNDAANAVFGQTFDGWWLYAVAFPFVAVNFGSMVLMLRGRRGLLRPFLVSAAAIAIMPAVGWQVVIYRDFWSDMLSFAGYGIGGAIATIVYFRLDSASLAYSAARDKEAATPEDTSNG